MFILQFSQPRLAGPVAEAWLGACWADQFETCRALHLIMQGLSIPLLAIAAVREDKEANLNCLRNHLP